LKPPEATFVELEAMGEPESYVESAASAVDKCCKKIASGPFILVIGQELICYMADFIDSSHARTQKKGT